MIKIKTIENDEKYLRQISKEVDFNDKSYLEDIKKVEEYFKKPEPLYALATIQIGIPKRIIYLRNTTLDEEKYNDYDYNESKVLINPVIISRKGHTEFWEACGSCLDYIGLIERPYQIEIEYYDINGKKQAEHFEGFEATILSHEYDHLDGILHLDIAKELTRLPIEHIVEFRKKHPYKIISKDDEYIRKTKKDD